MLLFVKTTGAGNERVVIPLNRVYDIVTSSCSVFINYECGDIVSVEGTFQKKIETVRVVFDSSDEVNKIMRQFFKACRDNVSAFYFAPFNDTYDKFLKSQNTEEIAEKKNVIIPEIVSSSNWIKGSDNQWLIKSLM